MQKLFDCSEQISESEINAIFDAGAEEIQTEVIPPSDEYFAERRKLIGPAADITHPDFGRPNLPEETYMIYCHIREEPHIAAEIRENGRKVYRQQLNHVVEEYVVDHLMNLVRLEAPH